jgi:hypothetical protein
MPPVEMKDIRSLQQNIPELLVFLEEVEGIFRKEPNILKVPKAPCVFIGDTHGDLAASKMIVEKYLSNENNTLIFLGDYVDRGYAQLENVLFLFSLKREYPKRILLLRGNHEEEEMNKSYGFHELLYMKYMGKSDDVFQQFQHAFAHLPLCVLTWNRILGLHGGIPISLEKGVISLEEIAQLQRGATHFEQFDPITAQLLWNDPRENPGATPSPRGIGFFFGPDKFEEFVSFNNIDLVIRSHEVFESGFKTFFGNKLISIFSAQTYIYCQPIQAKVVELDPDGKVALKGITD